MQRLLLALALLALASASARADVAPSPDAALARGQYETALNLAREALEEGTRAGAELAPLLLVEAKASALLGDEERARRAFTQLLAVDPAFRLGQQEADEVRSPYMEARGFWSTHVAPFRVQVAASEARDALVAQLLDPAGMAARVRVRLRVEEGREPLELVKPAAERVTFEVPDLALADAVSYSVALLDEHGNRIWQEGSDGQPTRLVLRVEARTDVADSGATAAVPPRSRARLVAGGLGVALGVGGLALGAYAHAQRERLAARWNDGDCDGAGDTRAARCGDEKDELERDQLLAGVSYGVGAAALVAGVVLLVRSRPRPDRARQVARWSCTPLERLGGARCAVRF